MNTVAKGVTPVRRALKYLGLFVLCYALFGVVVFFTPISNLATSTVEIRDDRCHRIFLRRNTVHMALILNAEDLRRLGGADIAALSTKPWIDIGWGDHQFYTRLKELHGLKRLVVIANALLWPSYSSVHLAGIASDPMKVYETGEIPLFETMEFMKRLPRSVTELRLPSRNLANLVAHLRGEFQSFAPIQRGRFNDGRFYASTSSYHLLATCTSWIAEDLRQAGFRVNPRLAILPKVLLAELAEQSLDLCPASLPVADYGDGGDWAEYAERTGR